MAPAVADDVATVGDIGDIGGCCGEIGEIDVSSVGIVRDGVGDPAVADADDVAAVANSTAKCGVGGDVVAPTVADDVATVGDIGDIGGCCGRIGEIDNVSSVRASVGDPAEGVGGCVVAPTVADDVATVGDIGDIGGCCGEIGEIDDVSSVGIVRVSVGDPAVADADDVAAVANSTAKGGVGGDVVAPAVADDVATVVNSEGGIGGSIFSK